MFIWVQIVSVHVQEPLQSLHSKMFSILHAKKLSACSSYNVLSLGWKWCRQAVQDRLSSWCKIAVVSTLRLLDVLNTLTASCRSSAPTYDVQFWILIGNEPLLVIGQHHQKQTSTVALRRPLTNQLLSRAAETSDGFTHFGPKVFSLEKTCIDFDVV